MTRQQTSSSFFSFLYEQRLTRLLNQDAHKKKRFKSEIELQKNNGRYVSIEYRKLLREKINDQWYGPTPDEIEIEAKEKWAANGKKELDELSERLEFCPRCGTLAICPEFINFIKWPNCPFLWLCLSCYSKLRRHHGPRDCQLNHELQFLSFLCKDVMLIITGKQPRLWMRHKLPYNHDLRKAIIRESRRQSDKVESRVYPSEGVYIPEWSPLR
jgi:hypothetical protein